MYCPNCGSYLRDMECVEAHECSVLEDYEYLYGLDEDFGLFEELEF